MRVMHLLASDKFSGAENVACQIIKMFDGSGVEMVYVSPHGEIERNLKEKAVPFFGLDALNKKQLEKAIEKFKPDVIHAHDMRASFEAHKIKGEFALISHIHNNSYKSRKLSLKSIAYYFAAKKAKAIIWVSESAQDGYIFSKHFMDKSKVLHNVIDAAVVYDKANADLAVYDYDAVFLGRLAYEKNPERLIKIVKRVCEKKPDFSVAIVGTGELEEQAKTLASELGIEGNVKFFGFKENPYKILQCSKVMLLSSRWEGLPMCVLEAMSFGVPVVSTVTDGVKNVVLSGENGYLSDDDEVLAESIYQLVTDQKKRKEFSEKAKKRFCQINNLTNYKSQLKEIYDNALKNK